MNNILSVIKASSVKPVPSQCTLNPYQAKENKPRKFFKISPEDSWFILQQSASIQRLWHFCWHADPMGDTRFGRTLEHDLGKTTFKAARKFLSDHGLFRFEAIASNLRGRKIIGWRVFNLHGSKNFEYWNNYKDEENTGIESSESQSQQEIQSNLNNQSEKQGTKKITNNKLINFSANKTNKKAYKPKKRPSKVPQTLATQGSKISLDPFLDLSNSLQELEKDQEKKKNTKKRKEVNFSAPKSDRALTLEESSARSVPKIKKKRNGSTAKPRLKQAIRTNKALESKKFIFSQPKLKSEPKQLDSGLDTVQGGLNKKSTNHQKQLKSIDTINNPISAIQNYDIEQLINLDLSTMSLKELEALPKFEARPPELSKDLRGKAREKLLYRVGLMGTYMTALVSAKEQALKRETNQDEYNSSFSNFIEQTKAILKGKVSQIKRQKLEALSNKIQREAESTDTQGFDSVSILKLPKLIAKNLDRITICDRPSELEYGDCW